MEAQAAAQKLQQQQAAAAAAAAATAAAAQTIDEPTDLTLDAEEKAIRVRERLERERYLAEAKSGANSSKLKDNGEDRDREEHRSFDFRHLIPQVSIKTENYWTFMLYYFEIRHLMYTWGKRTRIVVKKNVALSS